MPGARSDRPGLDEAMNFMREGDTLKGYDTHLYILDVLIYIIASNYF